MNTYMLLLYADEKAGAAIPPADMAAAQKWAAQCPGAIWGHIEIRPVSYQG